MKDMGGYYISTELIDLTEEQKEKLFDWINKNLVKTKKIYHGHTAYGMKHYFHHDTGIYITTWVFRDAMQELGFRVKQISKENYCFNISKHFKTDMKGGR